MRLKRHNKECCVVSVERHTSRELRRLAGENYASLDELLGLKALPVPRIPGIDWHAFVRFVHTYEQGPMPFIARKLLTRQLPSSVLGGVQNQGLAVQCVTEAIAADILELYYVPNPKIPGTQTAAVRLNRANEFVKSVLGLEP